jgi:arylsulfatase A-like enzyme/Flp pilus assembly protein TadD
MPHERLASPLSLLALAMALLACQAGERATFRDAPVVLVSIDTLRADRLTAYGGKRVATPAFDRLAAEGLLFENAYAHVPLTLPSHATLLTGKLPPDTGVRSNIGFSLAAPAGSSLPELLAARGYATGGAVSAYVLRADTGMGRLFSWYDDSLEVWESATLGALQRRGDDTLATALRWADGVGDRPLFLFLHLFEPHTPYEPAEPFRSRYADPYDGEVATADAILGRLLAELDRRGLYDRALIAVTSDHGEGLGDHGEAEHGVLLYREALHVPLLLKLPGGARAGERIAAPVGLVDLLPTLAGAAGAEVPAGLPGTSLLSLAGGSAPPARAIYGETLYPRLHLGWSELRSLVDDRHHYIEGPQPELYDVVTDPGERNDLRSSHRREAAALRDRLAEVPLALAAPGSADPEEMQRLAALGYLGAPAAAEGPRRNPREHIAVLARVQETFLLNQQGRYRESVEVCREILRDYPELVDVYNQMAGNLRRLGRLDEALTAYREAVTRSPSLIDSLAIEIGKLELDLGNLEAAALNAEQAMKLNPDEAHLLLAGVAVKREDWAAAEREARLARGDEALPRVPALLVLAKVLAEQGKLPAALAELERAARRVIESGHPVPTLASTRGDVLARMGRTSEAESSFREEIARFPGTTDAYVRLSILLASQRRFAEIEPLLEAMVAATPLPATYELAARALDDLGNEQGARDFRRRGERRRAELRAAQG